MNYVHRTTLPVIDLYELGLDAQPSYNFRNGSMHDQEAKIKTELTSKGYECGKWQDGERDSFGPLSRMLHVRTPEGEDKVICYG